MLSIPGQRTPDLIRGQSRKRLDHEVDILGLVAKGLSNAQIGTRRHISVRTVDHHVAAILRKLDVSSRGEAVRRAQDLRLVEPR